jgi:hypothetical protein
VPNWSILRNYKNIWNSTKDRVTIGMFVTCRPSGAKPQVKRALIDRTRIDPLELTLFSSVPTRWNLGLPVVPRELVCLSLRCDRDPSSRGKI